MTVATEPSARRFSAGEAARWAVASLPAAPLAALAYFLLEWLFFVTRPSATGSLPFSTQLAVLMRSPLPLLIPLLGAQAAASLLSTIGYPRMRGIAMAPAALVCGALLLLLIDNFTYTLFGVGILTAGPVMRFVYAALVPALVVAVGWKLSIWFSHLFHRRGIAPGAVALALLLACAPAAGARRPPPPPDQSEPPPSQAAGAASDTRPNILFLGIDGVDADILSAYGYARRTSPFLETLGDETLFFENAFSNVARTHGSLVTLLTGRLPFTTRVTFPPTVLQGEDAHRNLPAILKPLGYTTLQVGMRHYADAEDANLLGFDAANYRWQRLEDVRPGADTADEADVFRAAVAERLAERVGYLFAYREVANAFAHVEGQQESPMWKDERRIQTLLRYFPRASEPWFIHLHLLDTHCCNYHPDQMHFSDGRSITRDARDSELLETDGNIRKLFDGLRATGSLERTIVVISSDHTSDWKTTERVPLIIRFPGSRVKGRVAANVQLADVAPTILAYLGADVPGWMDGISLLEPGKLPASRPIFGLSDVTARSGAAGTRNLLDSGPPNYGAASAMMVAGSQWFDLSLADGTLRSGQVKGHTGQGLAPVPEAKARALILAQLAAAGFEIRGPR